MSYPKCVGCGYCCISFPCSYAVHNGWGDAHNRCIKLHWDGGKYRCAEHNNPTLDSNVGFGAGCPSTLFNEWRKDVKER